MTEDISNMQTQELAHTNITCTYTLTRTAPKQVDKPGKKLLFRRHLTLDSQVHLRFDVIWSFPVI